MKAGRELDALVAEKVMGLEDAGYYRRESCNTSEWVKAEKGEPSPFGGTAGLYYPIVGTRDNPVSLIAVPEFSVRISAAWEVWEATVGLENASLHRCYTGEGGGFPALADKLWWEVRRTDNVDLRLLRKKPNCFKADTAPHAICLAALKVVEIEL